MFGSSKDKFFDQLRRVIKDGVDYFTSSLTLLQARITDFSLSAVVFVLLILLATLMALAAFVFLNIVFGLWLAQSTGSTSLALSLLGLLYALLAGVSTLIALRWLKHLQS